MGHKKLEITVKAFADGAGGHRFEMWNDDGQQITDETIVFEKPLTGSKKMKKVDHHRVGFELNNNGTNLKFADQDNAFFIDVEGGTPGKGKHADVFWVDERASDSEIHVINMNLKKQRYKFTLNFLPIGSPDNGGPYIEYDPIGENKNGGGPGSERFLSVFLSAGAGLLAGLVAFAAARMFLPEW